MVQDTYWVVSHIHYVLVAGAVFAIFAALFYWFPKMTGRRLYERLGKVQFWLLFIGTNLAFFPQHLLGLDGMIRRIADYSGNAGWTRAQLPVHDRRLHHRRLACCPSCGTCSSRCASRMEHAADPWDANTLEWATTSPPPLYNFDSLPPVHSERPLFDLKHPGVGHGPTPEPVAPIDSGTAA